ncbi:ABC transporter [Kitasatospora sp. NBC_01287]|uniref:ABC transporter n=1 Tax=Kitasatospora sp. NBC_01287 TaxID=2903573 RepID=UPI00224CFBF6|nr:ABC transporter [Kitasatospora sp. NBC_01287]MCX4747148.1 ABC transporter [Kitasatospora sp. NBC_01287]
MSALIRYQLALLLRSQRWLPPFLAYLLVLGTGVAGDQPMMDCLGYAAAVLVPVTAWYARCTLTADPPQARACLVAAAGAARVQLASLAAALVAGLVLAVLEVVAIWLVCGRTTILAGHEVPWAQAALAGLLAAVCGVLVGVAAGALSHRPVLLRGSYGILAALGLSVLALVVPHSPANAAVRALVLGSQLARVRYPLAALAVAALLALLAAAGTAALARRRTE